MKLTDSTTTARRDYASAVCGVLGLDQSKIEARMDRELADLRARVESPSDQRWYASIEAGKPDYGIYDDAEYMLYLWPGTVLFARPTIKWVAKEVPSSGVRTVVDLGCGIGYSTALLADAYPGADVYGTNVEGVQARVARNIGKVHRFQLVPSAAEVPANPSGTLVVASEYFEHFYEPVDHLESVLFELERPRWMAIANAFGAHSAGHFPEYRHGARALTPKQTGRLFNDTLRGHGYVRLGSGWNGRPTLWGRP